ncbi:unnamed protein product [Prunus armeniaca]
MYNQNLIYKFTLEHERLRLILQASLAKCFLSKGSTSRVRKDDTLFFFFGKCDWFPFDPSNLAIASFSEAENLWVPAVECLELDNFVKGIARFSVVAIDVLVGRVEEGKYLDLPILRVLEIELAFGVLATFVPVLLTLKTIPPLSSRERGGHRGCRSEGGGAFVWVVGKRSWARSIDAD